MVVKVLIEERKRLRSGDTIPTVHSQVPRLGTSSQHRIKFPELVELIEVHSYDEWDKTIDS